MTSALRALLVVVALGGCKDKPSPPSEPATRAPPVPHSELRRGQEACHAYVAKVCACAATVPAASDPCKLSKALPEAIDVSMQVAVSPESQKKDVLHAAQVIRQTAAECIEQTAKLPLLGCP